MRRSTPIHRDIVLCLQCFTGLTFSPTVLDALSENQCSPNYLTHTNTNECMFCKQMTQWFSTCSIRTAPGSPALISTHTSFIALHHSCSKIQRFLQRKPLTKKTLPEPSGLGLWCVGLADRSVVSSRPRSDTTDTCQVCWRTRDSRQRGHMDRRRSWCHGPCTRDTSRRPRSSSPSPPEAAKVRETILVKMWRQLFKTTLKTTF